MLKAFICLCVSAIILNCISGCASINKTDSDVPAIITDQSQDIQQNNQNHQNYQSTQKNEKTENEVIYNLSNINDITFLGESTTYHLKSRGVLLGGKETTQVWAPKSGTLMLDPSISDCRIVYPETNQELSLEEALKRKKPKKLLLTFGLNGATSFITRGESYFKFCYKKLLDLIKEASPSTQVIINSCFPVAKNMDMSRYTVDAKTLNLYIDTLNIWAQQLAKDNGAIFTDSASVLKDSDGYLKPDLQAEDGYHLNVNAYKLILNYLNNKLQSKEN